MEQLYTPSNSSTPSTIHALAYPMQERNGVYNRGSWFIALDSNIAGGKTTLLNVAAMHPDALNSITFVREPMDALLPLLIDATEKQRIGVATDTEKELAVMRLESAFIEHHQFYAEQRGKKTIIIERSLKGVVIFVRTFFELGILGRSSYARLLKEINRIERIPANRPQLTIYVRVSVDEIMRRIRKRAANDPSRQFELNYTREFIERLQKSYDEEYPVESDSIIILEGMKSESESKSAEELLEELAPKLEQKKQDYIKLLQQVQPVMAAFTTQSRMSGCAPWAHCGRLGHALLEGWKNLWSRQC